LFACLHARCSLCFFAVCCVLLKALRICSGLGGFEWGFNGAQFCSLVSRRVLVCEVSKCASEVSD
jgi:hypothetical protein